MKCINREDCTSSESTQVKAKLCAKNIVYKVARVPKFKFLQVKKNSWNLCSDLKLGQQCVSSKQCARLEAKCRTTYAGKGRFGKNVTINESNLTEFGRNLWALANYFISFVIFCQHFFALKMSGLPLPGRLDVQPGGGLRGGPVRLPARLFRDRPPSHIWGSIPCLADPTGLTSELDLALLW